MIMYLMTPNSCKGGWVSGSWNATSYM